MPTASESDDDEADEQRVARAVDDAREDVATDRIGAEGKGQSRPPAGRRQQGAELRYPAHAAPSRGEERHQHQRRR